MKALWRLAVRRALARGRVAERLVLAVTAGAIVAMTGATAIFAWRARDNAFDQWRQYMEHFTALAAAHAMQTVNGADQALKRVIEGVQASGIDDEQEFRRLVGSRATHDILVEIDESVPQLGVLIIAADNGDVLDSSREFSESINLADRGYFRAYQSDGVLDLYISEPVKDRVTGRWIFHLVRRIRGKSGRPLGLALAGIESRFVADFYENLTFGARDSVTLLRADGTVLARAPWQVAAVGRKLTEGVVISMLAAGLDHATALSTAPRFLTPSAHDLRMVSSRVVRQYPLAVTTTVGEEIILRRWRAMCWFMGTAVALVDTLALVVGCWLYRLLRRQRLTVERLRCAKAAADAANRAKSDFLANMSHEIRTPLNGIIGYGELLALDLKGTPQEPFADAITQSGRNLLALVNDVLDIRRIESGAVRLDIAPHSLCGLLEDIAREHRPLAESKGIRLDVVNEGAPSCLLCDRTRLRQALNNLVHNAIKFTGRGGVRLSAHPHPEGVEFRVADTGPGIDAAHHAAIFERFVQVDASRGREHDGSGLGLAIARDLAHLMGGRIGLESAPGAGSVFSLVLPVQVQEAVS